MSKHAKNRSHHPLKIPLVLVGSYPETYSIYRPNSHCIRISTRLHFSKLNYAEMIWSVYYETSTKSLIWQLFEIGWQKFKAIYELLTFSLIWKCLHFLQPFTNVSSCFLHSRMDKRCKFLYLATWSKVAQVGENSLFFFLLLSTGSVVIQQKLSR